MAISNTFKFWFYLIFLIPSTICSIFILCHLLFHRHLRYGLNNHVIIIVIVICLIAQTTIYPWMIYFYQYKGTWKRSLIFCEIWGYLDWGFYVARAIIFAWATLERHILIFHDKWVLRRKKTFLYSLSSSHTPFYLLSCVLSNCLFLSTLPKLFL